MSSVMPRNHGGHNVLCFDMWGNGGNVAKSPSFEHSGLLCCDPWSDSPGWLLIAPATLHQTDGNRGSMTWVQGKCNDMDAPQAFCLPSCLSLFSPLLFLLCNDLFSSLYISFSLSFSFPQQIAALAKVFECIMQVIWLSRMETSCACSMPFTELVFLSK